MKKTYNISLQQIQIFLKAIELKNFTKVAEYFCFTPSMISKTITSIEDELDIKLFVRKPHEFSPTPAGILLAQEWRQLIGSINNSIAKAHELQASKTSRIVFGFVDSSDNIDNLVSRSLSSYREAHPDTLIIAEKHDMHRAVELLNYGMLDVVITDAMEVPYLTEHNIPWEKQVDTSIAIYVPRDNPLFEQESLSLKDLKGQKMLALDATMHPSYNTWLYALCEANGFSPKIVSTYRTVRSLAFNLKLSDAVFIGDSITSDWCDDSLKSFPTTIPSYSVVAWKNDASSELIQFKNYMKTKYPDYL